MSEREVIVKLIKNADGTFTRGNTAAAISGRNNAGRTVLSYRAGKQIPKAAAFFHYRTAAKHFCRRHVAIMMDRYGQVGPGPNALIVNGSLQLAWSRYYQDKAAEQVDPSSQNAMRWIAMASKLSADAARSLQAAELLCAAESKRKGAEADPVKQLANLLMGSKGKGTSPS